MNSYQACRVCGEPSIQVYNILEEKVIDGVIIGQNRYYCSQKCRKEDNKGEFSSLILILAVGALIFSQLGVLEEIIGVVIFIVLIVLTVALVMMGTRRRANLIHAPYTKALAALSEELSENQPVDEEFLQEYLSDEKLQDLQNLEVIAVDSQLEVSDDKANGPIPLRMNPENYNQMYSDILQQYVEICCHQSARLRDKYCMCGKALSYPTIKD